MDIETLAELRAREQEVEWEWQWLHDEHGGKCGPNKVTHRPSG
jgi:hypothetical protein